MKVHYIFFLAVCLLTESCDQRPHADRKLFDHLHDGDTNYVQQFLNSGGSINQAIYYMPYGKITAPALDIAIKYGQQKMVEFLLVKGANPNQRDSTGATPLIWAIARGSDDPEVTLQIVRMLLRAKANPNLANSSHFGWTPLIYASSLGQTGTVKVLLDGGAQVNATNSDGLTALHFAANAAIANLLLAAGAK